MLARLTLLSAVVALLAAAPASAAAPCPTGARCATLTVPLDHTGAVPGTQTLSYAVLPATGPRVGTIAFLAGGPGQSAIPLVADVADVLKGVRGSYDLLFLDQRGTGDSGAVGCDFNVDQCAGALGDRRTFMTTVETAKDLEDVRAAIGVDPLVVLGVSYGTKVAGEYARRFPAHTAALVLDSAVGTDGLDAVGLNAIKSAPRMLTEVCAADASCKRTVPNVENALTQAAHRLQRGAVRGPLVTTSGRVIGRVRVRETALLDALAAADLDPVLRSELPAAVASLAHGDAAPLIHSIVRVPSSTSARFGFRRGGLQDDSGINSARFFATFCTESALPWAPDAPLAGRAGGVGAYLAALGGASAFAPFSPTAVYDNSTASLCAKWPPTARPEPVATPGPPVRTLILSGRDDTRTPLEDAQRIASSYPNVRVLAVPDTGHSVLRNDFSGCATDGLAAFLAGGEPVPCEQRTGAKAPKPLLAAVAYRAATSGGLRAVLAKGRPGHTAAAVLVTLEGVFHDAAAEAIRTGLPRRTKVEGLRSGSLVLSRSGIELHAAEWVTGVRVTGSVSYKGTGRISVSGPAAAAGSLRLRKGKVDGQLGGKRVKD